MSSVIEENEFLQTELVQLQETVDFWKAQSDIHYDMAHSYKLMWKVSTKREEDLHKIIDSYKSLIDKMLSDNVRWWFFFFVFGLISGLTLNLI